MTKSKSRSMPTEKTGVSGIVEAAVLFIQKRSLIGFVIFWASSSGQIWNLKGEEVGSSEKEEVWKKGVNSWFFSTGYGVSWI